MESRRINGSTVRVIREALGVRHGDLASRAGIDRGYLTKIEQGSRQPSPAVIVKVAQGLGVPVESITYPVAAGKIPA